MKLISLLFLLLSSTKAFQTPSISRAAVKVHSAPPAVEETASTEKDGKAALSRDRYVATNREFLFAFIKSHLDRSRYLLHDALTSIHHSLEIHVAHT
jgi:hypothetical protein